MKFIHTADWHLGNKMHEVERTKEFENFFNWLKNTIIEEKAEALVVAGDIFDTANPPTEAKAMYIKFLASLIGSDCRNIIIVGGNHDSGSLLDSEKPLLEYLNIHVVGSVSNIKAEDMVFELVDKDNKPCCICCAIPYAHEIELRKYFDEESDIGTFSDKAYSGLYNSVLSAAKEKDGGRNLPLIATGHLYAADLEGRFESFNEEVVCDDGKRKLDIVGKLGLVHSHIFSDEFDYVALGHIHYTTMVGKNPKIRYSGSPFTLGFDEAALPRYVLSVEINKGKETFVSKIKIPSYNIYKRISGNCESIRNQLQMYDRKQEKPVYVEICYKREDGINIHDELEDLITELEDLNVYVISRKVQVEENDLFDTNYSFDSREVKNLLPEDIFKALILRNFPEDLSSLSEEDAEKRKDEVLNSYLSIFMEAYNRAEANNFGDKK